MSIKFRIKIEISTDKDKCTRVHTESVEAENLVDFMANKLQEVVGRAISGVVGETKIDSLLVEQIYF